MSHLKRKRTRSASESTKLFCLFFLLRKRGTYLAEIFITLNFSYKIENTVPFYTVLQNTIRRSLSATLWTVSTFVDLLRHITSSRHPDRCSSFAVTEPSLNPFIQLQIITNKGRWPCTLTKILTISVLNLSSCYSLIFPVFQKK